MKTLLKEQPMYDNEEIETRITATFGGKACKDLCATVKGLSKHADITISGLTVFVYDRAHKVKHAVSLMNGSVETKPIDVDWD